MKSVEYALNPPLVLMTNNNVEIIDGIKKKKICNESPSFKEISNMKMNDLQKDTMKILIEEDMKIEKLRGAKVNITMDDDPNIPINDQIETKSNFNKGNLRGRDTDMRNNHINEVNNLANNADNPGENNDKNNFSLFQKDGPIDLNLPGYIFLETKSSSFLTQSGGKFTKPISVTMKLPTDPDASIQQAIKTAESQRNKFETNLFSKAQQEFKLITALTTAELQKHLNHEMLPFFVISKNAVAGVGSIISANIRAGGPARFLQIDQEELEEKFPNLEIAKDQEVLNKYVYSKILNLFSDNPELYTDTLMTKIIKDNSNAESRNTQEMKGTGAYQDDSDKPNNFNNILNFNYERCMEMARQMRNLDCDEKLQDYMTLTNYMRTSFMEISDSDLINVKFSANDDPYPTIEKLIAQMMTRRDLAEIFERLKILEYETHLQKADNEMIQDMLHDKIYKIMALYGPAVEGIKEHIR